MSRPIPLSSLTEREKDTTILVLSGFIKDLRGLLDDLGRQNGWVKRRYEKVLESRNGSMDFLERAYVRSVESPKEVERRAAQNDRVWQRAGGEF